MASEVLFYLFAGLAIASAISMVWHRNPLYSAISLVGVFIALSCIYVTLAAPFIAAVQILIYAGAIMVLFVFVIMLLNAGVEEQTKGSRVAILLGIPGMLLGSLLIAWVVLKHSGTGEVAVGALPGAPNVIGQLLFHEFLLPFEITSILILIAIMGAVVLASKPTVPGGGPAKKVQG